MESRPTLVDLVDNERTDKNTTHSYLPVYEELFAPRRDSATNVLEIGIGPFKNNGGSIKLWRDYFTNATVHAIDVITYDFTYDALKCDPRILLYNERNAYDTDFVENKMLHYHGAQFDVLIDDGPHSLESMIFFVREYSKLLKDDGVLIVEDIQDFGWTERLRENTPEHLRPYIQVRDLCGVKGRYDDILFIIDRRCEKST